MQQVGIGGMQNFDANLGTPQVVEKRLVYMQPDWKDAFRFATSEAERNGLELAIAASPGWSETGGPWVQPKDALKKLVWSETTVQGGTPVRGALPQPPATTGPYGDQALNDPLAFLGEGQAKAAPSWYADVAVLALPVAAGAAPALPRATTASGGSLDASALTDGRLATSVNVDRGSASAPGTVTLAYAAPITARAVTLSVSGATVAFGDPTVSPVLEVRDGDAWRRVADLPLSDAPVTAAFAPVTAREFRVVFLPYSGAPKPGLGDPAPGAVQMSFFGDGAAARPLHVAEFTLSEVPKVHRFEQKAGFAIANDYYALEVADGAVDRGAEFVAPAAVRDITAKLRADGTLDWTPPAGTWRILRLGYSLTGVTNHPATPEATGLEVDKYDGDAVRRYLETYLASYRDTVGDAHMGKQGLRALLTDSIEVGPSNWTPKLREQFRRLRGYDPLPWLPVLTGTVIGSRERSDAFLYDFRRTLADLLASQHYATVAKVAHEHGLTLYGEALEDVRPVLGDDIAMRAHADVPMAALWSYGRGSAPRPTLLGDMRGAASAAHLYGQNVVAAESLTSANAPWAFAPSDLRTMIDLEFANGVNRPVIHTSVHQPLDDKQPGFSLAIFGQYFNRHETWAGMAKPWVDYIARNGYLLQQGRNVADVAYFYGEEQPLTALYAFAPLRDTPVRHAWDFVNADVLRDVAVPELLVKGQSSPHTYALKPSDARALHAAHVFVRVSGTVEPFTTKMLASLPASVAVVTLQDIPDIKRLPQRRGPSFAGHGHDTPDKDTDHDHGHGEETDGHIWLDPDNARIIARHVGGILAEKFPAHAVALRRNVEDLESRLGRLDAELRGELSAVAGKPYVVFHDAFQYLEQRYHLGAVGSIIVSPDVPPSGKRLLALRREITSLRATCVFGEPQSDPRILQTIVEGSAARIGVLDAEGLDLEPGPSLYFKLMRALARNLRTCLAPGA